MAHSGTELHLGPDDDGRRADRIVRKAMPELPLSAIHRLFRDGNVRRDGKKVGIADRLQEGTTIVIRSAGDRQEDYKNARTTRTSPQTGPVHGPDTEALATMFRSMIILETSDIIFVDKPAGMLTHGGHSGPENGLAGTTLDSRAFVGTFHVSLDLAARAYLAPGMAASVSFVPAPLHRLDRNTSGVIAVSASLKGARLFSAALAAGTVKKWYLALLDGTLTGPERWTDTLVRDRSTRTSTTATTARHANAVTLVAPVAVAGGLTLALVTLETGRTHQIRAQSAAHGLPLSGDVKYGGSRCPEGYLLHSTCLHIPAGILSESSVTVQAPVPEKAGQRLQRIFGDGIHKKIHKALAAVV